MKSLFNIFKKDKEKQRIIVKIKNGNEIWETKLSSIYNFDNSMKPIVLTIPANKETISITDEDIISMIQFIMRNYPNKGFEQAIQSLGKINIMFAIGIMPEIFTDMTFNYVDPTKVTEGFQYFTSVILKGDNNTSIGTGIFFNVVKEENINKYFTAN
ncbi:MAG: hypothetical protein IJA94_01060 [Bacilli bacterium]|nr:hypothetical protein [Bacilli bacterium]